MKKNKKLIIAFFIVLIIFIFVYISTLFNKNKTDYRDPYFRDVKYSDNSEQAIKQEIQTRDLKIISPILLEINKDPVVLRSSLGDPDEIIQDIEMYYDKGFRVKRNYGAIVSIVFDHRYNGELFDGIDLRKSYEQNLIKLGIKEPDLEKNVLEVGNLYFTIYQLYDEFKKELYTELEVIPKQNFDYDKFKELTEKYLDDGYIKLDNKNKSVLFKEYINILTKEIPRYTSFKYDEDYVELEYADAGITIRFDGLVNGGIYLFKNYRGKKIASPFIRERKETLNIISRLNQNIEPFLKSEDRKVGQYKDSNDIVILGNVDEKNGENFENCIILSTTDKFNMKALNEISKANSIFVYKNMIYYMIDGDGIYLINPYTNTKSLIKIIREQAKIIDIDDDKIQLSDNRKINY